MATPGHEDSPTSHTLPLLLKMNEDKKVDGNLSVEPVLDSAALPPQKVSVGQKILYSLWDSDQHLKSAAERAFVRKLDFAILTCATLGVS